MAETEKYLVIGDGQDYREEIVRLQVENKELTVALALTLLALMCSGLVHIAKWLVSP